MSDNDEDDVHLAALKEASLNLVVTIFSNTDIANEEIAQVLISSMHPNDLEDVLEHIAKITGLGEAYE